MDTDKLAEVLGDAVKSRRDVLKVAAAAGLGAALTGAVRPFSASAATDYPQTIINVALVAEHLAVTFITNTLGNASTIGFTPAEVTTLQGILATEALHVRYLQAYGATALGTYGSDAQAAFNFPSGTFSNRLGWANTAIFLETAFVAAYMAANREFAASGRSDLAQLTYQLGSVEAEHRALARAVGGYAPFANRAFEADLVPNVAAAATVLSGNGGHNFNFLSDGGYQYFDVLTSNGLNYASLLVQTTPG